MLRNKIIAIVALAVVGLASPTGASARGGGFGYFGPYIYGDYPYDYGGYYGDDGGCYLVTRRVLTRYGWRRRRVEVCD